jgi:hypothetical protein
MPCLKLGTKSRLAILGGDTHPSANGQKTHIDASFWHITGPICPRRADSTMLWSACKSPGRERPAAIDAIVCAWTISRPTRGDLAWQMIRVFCNNDFTVGPNATMAANQRHLPLPLNEPRGLLPG